MSGTELAPYRSLGIVPAEEPSKFEPIASGCLLRALPEPPKHKCKPPGFFKRIGKGIKTDDMWFCSCGYGAFKYIGWIFGWMSPWSDYSSMPTSIEFICENAGVERPYQTKTDNG